MPCCVMMKKQAAAAAAEDASAAQGEGLSCGRYLALLALQETDPSVTAEDVREMSMREIYEQLGGLPQGLHGEHGAGSGNCGSESGGSGGHGHHAR